MRRALPEALPGLSKALIVDDAPGNLLSLAALLEGLSCSVETARSGEEALRLLLREQFAVMLLDVRMPDMDGFEVARHVRMHAQTRDLPIIFLTAGANDDDAHQRLGYDCGAVDFLFKPINREALRSKVNVFVELHARRRELADTNARLEAANSKLLALAEAEATAASSLRQAHDELASAYRGLRLAQDQLIGATTVTASDDFPALDGFPALEPTTATDPLSSVMSHIDLARSDLARLRNRARSGLTPESVVEWEKLKALLSDAASQLRRLRDWDGKSAHRAPVAKPRGVRS
jgi:CheY-like chemotaxis protein